MSSIDKYTLHVVIEPVKSVLSGIQIRESPVHGGKTRTKYRVIPGQIGFSE